MPNHLTDKYYVTNPNQSWYGETIGILILDASYPCIYGNVGNATTFPFPVRYKEVKGSSIDKLLNKMDKKLIKPFIEAAQELEKEGVKAISGACGFMALFQKELQESVSIPVFVSSLLQIPFIYQITQKKIGVITANKKRLTPKHFISVGVDTDKIPIIMYGMENKKEFREAILEEKGSLNSSQIEKEVLEVATKMQKENPDIGSVVLECSDLPPYAHSIQKKLNVLVFDFVTMINYVYSALVKNKF